MKKIALGTSDFKKLREKNSFFIDKSLFIKEVIEEEFETILLPRPRRFGKTLNLSMLFYFFEKTIDDKSYLFKDLKIEKEPEFKKHFSKHPVIFLSFKDVKEKNFETFLDKIKELIIAEFRKHKYLLNSDVLDELEKEKYYQILSKKATYSIYSNSLEELSKWLYSYHKEKVIILIDEYDTPIHSSYYYNKLV